MAMSVRAEPQPRSNATQPYTGAVDRGWGAALTLIAICFILMIAARFVTARFTRYTR